MKPIGIARAAAASIVLASALAGPELAAAQGFLRWSHGPRATAMGGTGAGFAADPSAAYHAPAGIAWLDGTQIEAGGRLSTRGGTFHGFTDGDFDRETETSIAPVVSVTHAISERLTAGLTFGSPWQIDVEWERPDSFAGRFLTSGTRLTSLDATLAFAWRPGERWSVAVGPDIVYLRMDRDHIDHDPELSSLGGGGVIPLARAGYDLDGTAIGWVAGVFGRPHPGVSIGASFRSPVEVPLEGFAEYTVVAPQALRDLIRGSGTIGEILDETYVDQSARTDMPLPWIVSAGAAWDPVPSVTLAADVQRVGWGELGELVFAPLVSAPADTVPLGWEDAWTWRLGVEARRPSGLAIRAGYAREESPASEEGVNPMFPDAEREALSAGAGFDWGGSRFDLAYRLTVLDDREGIARPNETVQPDGVYESTEHDFALAVTRRF